MGLEDILRAKAERKAADELREQQEREGAARNAEALVEEQTKEHELAELRKGIEGIDAKIDEMSSLFDQLKTSHEKAGISVAAAKKEGQALKKTTAKVSALFADERYKAILAEEGIVSLDDLIAAEAYSDVEEVKALTESQQAREVEKKTARENLTARRQVKLKAKEIVTAEHPETAPDFSYAEISKVLEEVLQDLGGERKKMFYRTPEGQEALEEEIFEKIKERRKSSRSSSPTVEDLRYISAGDFVTHGDVRDAEQYGAETVKSVLKDYYAGVVDDEFAEKAKSGGDLELKTAVDQIENLPHQWQEIRNTLRELEEVKEETITRLSELLEASPELSTEIRNYGRWRGENARSLAKTFIEAMAKSNAQSFDLNYAKTPEEIFKETLREQEELLPTSGNGKIETKHFDHDTAYEKLRDDGFYATKLRNPESVSVLANEQLEFYKKFKDFLTTPEDVLRGSEASNNGLDWGASSKFGAAVNARSASDLGVGSYISYIKEGVRRIPLTLSFDGKTYNTLRTNSLYEIKNSLEKQRKDAETTAGILKDKINLKIEAQWTATEEGDFSRKNYSTIREAESLVSLREKARELSPQLNFAFRELEGQSGELVSVGAQGYIEFESSPISELNRLREEITRTENTIISLREGLAQIDRRAQAEGAGFLNRKENKRKEEKDELNKKIEKEQTALGSLKEEYDPKKKMDEKLQDLRTVLSKANRQGLVEKPSKGLMLLGDYIDEIKKQMDIQLTSEQQEIYDQYKELKKKGEEAKRQFEEAIRPSYR